MVAHMRILFIGSGAFGQPTLRMIREQRHEIVAVVSQPDRPAGRGRQSQPTPIRAFADRTGIPVLTPPKINEPQVIAEIQALKADLTVVVAFGQKIGAALLTAFPVGIVNLHGSLLPRLRGAAPVQWSILNGDAEVGVTVFRLVEKMDAGPILSQRRTVPGPDETAEELHDRLAAIGCDAVKGAMDRLARDPADPGDPQDESKATPAPKLSKADGILDLARPAIELQHRVNGLYSWPGAHCRFRSQAGRTEEVLLARAMAEDAPGEPTPPDQVGVISPRGGMVCGRGELAILEIQPQGGRKMDWQSFVNGRHVTPGDRFESLSSPL